MSTPVTSEARSIDDALLLPRNLKNGNIGEPYIVAVAHLSDTVAKFAVAAPEIPPSGEPHYRRIDSSEDAGLRIDVVSRPFIIRHERVIHHVSVLRRSLSLCCGRKHSSNELVNLLLYST
jgi:hypothetical protein